MTRIVTPDDFADLTAASYRVVSFWAKVTGAEPQPLRGTGAVLRGWL